MIQRFIIDVEMANGETFEVRTTQQDLIAWDETAAKHGWPSTDKAPMLWGTFLAWHALRRIGQYTGKWEEFKSGDCVWAQMREESETVDPTPPDPSVD